MSDVSDVSDVREGGTHCFVSKILCVCVCVCVADWSDSEEEKDAKVVCTRKHAHTP